MALYIYINVIGLGIYSVHILIRPTVSSITIYLMQYDRKTRGNNAFMMLMRLRFVRKKFTEHFCYFGVKHRTAHPSSIGPIPLSHREILALHHNDSSIYEPSQHRPMRRTSTQREDPTRRK